MFCLNGKTMHPICLSAKEARSRYSSNAVFVVADVVQTE